MKKLLVILFYFPIIVFSQDASINTIDLLGVWSFNRYDHNTDTYIYKKANDFNDKSSGIFFQEDYNLIKRKINGWCATPPVSYANFYGQWEKTTDSIIVMRYEDWGEGVLEEFWLIESLSNQELMIKVIESKVDQ